MNIGVVLLTIGFSVLLCVAAYLLVEMGKIVAECERAYVAMRQDQATRRALCAIYLSRPIPCPSCKTLVTRGDSPCSGCGIGLKW